MKFTFGLLCILAISFSMSSVMGFTGRALDPLNVRASPSTHSPVIGLFGTGAQIDIDCQVNAETASGFAGTTNVWYHVPSRGGYVSGAWVGNDGQKAPTCGGHPQVHGGHSKAHGGHSKTHGGHSKAHSPSRVHTERSETLNIRSGPNTRSSIVGSLGPNAEINIDCQTHGDNISGPSGTTTVWYHVHSRGFVSGAFVSAGRSYHACAMVAPGGSAPAPSNGADCSAGLPNPRSCAEAVAWARAHLTTTYNSEYRGLCDHFVGLAYGRSASTFDTALIHWQTTPERFRHYDKNPPAGALCFFATSAFGHATICTGNGGLISTDWGCPGCLGETTIDIMEARWGKFLGWTNPYFHNA